jgi:hypothetical protein
MVIYDDIWLGNDRIWLVVSNMNFIFPQYLG